MKELRIASDLALPTDAVTQTFGVLAKRGAGKTYTAAVMAEEMLKAGLQVAVVDPIGVWWGLRAGAGGKGPGLPIVILGGDHGDVPLDENSGQLAADLLVDEGISAVLDLSLLRKGQQVRFMTAFSERLYHRNRAPLHLVLDEADAFAPQRPMRDQARLLGAVEDLVRRGRARGIGVTLVTQRAAVINKDVLTQVEVLVALRTIAPQDRDAIDAWVRVHGTPEQREELMSSLPSLPIGTAWFWSPGWLDIFQRVKVRKRETFDSSATPKMGEAIRTPKQLADVDLEALRQRMAATLEKAKAEDPRELRRRIAELEKELKRRRQETEKVVERVEVPKEVPVLLDGDASRVEEVVSNLSQLGQELTTSADGLKRALEAVPREGVIKQREGTPGTELMRRSVQEHQSRRTGKRSVSYTEELPGPSSGGREVSSGGIEEGRITASQQRILDSLVWFGAVGLAPVDKTQLALFSGVSPRSSGYTNNLGSLRARGLIDYPSPGAVDLTDEGRARAQEPEDVPSTSEELQAAVCSRLSGSQARIVRALVERYPEDLDREELAETTGTSTTSSGYTNNLGALRTLGLIDYPSPGRVVARPVLFLG